MTVFTCRLCGGEFERSRRGRPRKYCKDCVRRASPYPQNKRVPCAGCGKKLHGGRGSLPLGERRCNECRRKAPKPRKKPALRARECKRCGVSFEVTSPNRYFCTKSCQKARTCVECGAAFSINYSGQITCGRECGWKYRRKNAPPKPPKPVEYPRTKIVYNTCEQCGVTFVGRRKGAICSHRCSYRRYAPEPTPRQFTCEECDRVFESIWAKTYCSTLCSKRASRRRHRDNRFRVRTAVRQALYERDRYLCHLCLEPVSVGVPYAHPWSPTLDHLTPRSLGGSDADDNLATAHRWCNSIRSDAPLGEVLYDPPPQQWAY